MTKTTSAPIAIGDDLLNGVPEIAEFLGQTQRRTYFLLEKGRIPAFKWGKVWQARRSAIVANIEERERRGAA